MELKAEHVMMTAEESKAEQMMLILTAEEHRTEHVKMLLFLSGVLHPCFPSSSTLKLKWLDVWTALLSKLS